MRCSKPHLYSITSLAHTSNEGGTVRPSALSVFMLMISPNLVGFTEIDGRRAKSGGPPWQEVARVVLDWGRKLGRRPQRGQCRIRVMSHAFCPTTKMVCPSSLDVMDVIG
jgi:hypothetical protein